MKLKKQRNKIRIRDYDRLACTSNLQKNKKKHGDLLPNNVRCIICGPSLCQDHTHIEEISTPGQQQDMYG